MEGERLTDEHLLHFCFLLLVAGNETTRNLVSLGTLALIDHPAELQKLLDDPSLIPLAIEEMLRWTTPVAHMARTATQDVEIRGTTIREGEMVVMLYGSANRDEDIFGADAEEFRVDRSPNPHVAFGFGHHLCLGASLARLEARVLFEEMLRRYPSLELVGECDPDAIDHGPGCEEHAGGAGVNFEYTPEQEALRLELRASLEKVMTPERQEALGRTPWRAGRSSTSAGATWAGRACLVSVGPRSGAAAD